MLASLSEVKSYLWIDPSDTSQDTLLTSLLGAADAFVKSYTGRDFEQQDYTHIFNWKGEYEFLLRQYPVTDPMTSFQYNSWTLSNPVWSNFDPDSYRLEPENGKIWMTFTLPKWLQNIRAIYEAWYAPEDIPEDVKQSVIQLTAFYFNSSKSDGIKSESVDGTGVVYDNMIPMSIKLTLNRYKNVSTF